MLLRHIQIPLDPEDLGGPFRSGTCVILGQKEGSGIAELEEVDENEVTWVEEFDSVYFQVQHDGETLKSIRLATDEDYQKYRVPLWIQSEEVPDCCGRPMSFVGQLNDSTICTEPPPCAKMWWHDAASFYVFTCPQCLSVQSIGQQY
jgi:hypothetical protein